MLFSFLRKKSSTDKVEADMKYLIVGIGNVGEEYRHTRHNMGFDVLDAFAEASNIFFTEKRYGAIAEYRLKGRQLFLLKPNTFVNLSGSAVRYWMTKENIPLSNILIVVDDLNLPLGAIRMRSAGNPGGHNGLKDIEAKLGTQAYSRLRIGIGHEFRESEQIDFVLGKWTAEQSELLKARYTIACDAIKDFVLQGIDRAMNLYNNK